jgi:LmbE family N-acetylglucosaminyl deacetylase
MTVPSRVCRNVVFVVCHPDDEALWVGGILCELPRFDLVRTYVICVSGNDPASPRPAEFAAAMRTAGYHAGIVLGYPLRPAPNPLPAVDLTVVEGLDKLGLSVADVDLLITHPPYGDEHLNPHHRQAYAELRAWTRANNVPFGYFSCLPIPYFAHTPVEDRFRRAGSFHLTNRSKCSFAIPVLRRLVMRGYADIECPEEYFQFCTDAERKRAMLDCYPSVDLQAHEATYAAFTSNCEGLYISDVAGVSVMATIVEQMPAPAPEPLFISGSWRERIAGRLKSLRNL